MHRLKVSVVGAEERNVAAQRIGIDFDNTIVDYESVFRSVAIRSGLADAHFAGGKSELRTLIRAQHGDLAWMRLQAVVYGHEISAATVYRGFREFIARARAGGAWLGIVSHKTEFAAAEPDGPNLRDAARAWLAMQGVLVRGIDAAQVYFEATREAKLARIAALDCTHFIDDLPEVFGEGSFPERVEAILFDPAGAAASGPYRRVRTWSEAQGLIFDGA